MTDLDDGGHTQRGELLASLTDALRMADNLHLSMVGIYICHAIDALQRDDPPADVR